MGRTISRFASALAIAAAAMSTATPAMAKRIYVPNMMIQGVHALAPLGWDATADTAAEHRRWGRRDRGIDAGDVIAGVVILGGIAAIASAASKSSQDRRNRDGSYPDRRYPDGGYPQQRDGDWGYGDSRGVESGGYRGTGGGIDRAVDQCVAEIESSRPVDSVDQASRDGYGWRVSGRVRGGQPFACNIDGDGRVRSVSIDGRAAWGAGY